jgi:hypothetical protein
VSVEDATEAARAKIEIYEEEAGELLDEVPEPADTLGAGGNGIDRET